MSTVLRPSTVVISQQMLQEKTIEATAQNLSNAATVGFKALAISGLEAPRKAYGEPVSYVKPTPYRRILDDGPAKQTSNPLDVAIRGEGYFQVQTPKGTRLTRAGQFQASPDNKLITSSGDYVLDVSGSPITLNSKGGVYIGMDGTISDEKGKIGQKLGVYKVEKEQELTNVGYGLYQTTQNPEAIEHPTLLQGYVEESNVTPITEITKMMQNLRSFENAQRMIDIEDDRQRKVINLSPKNSA